MNLKDFSPNITVSQIEANYKNQFAKPLAVSGLSLTESRKLLGKTQTMIVEYKNSGPKARYSEKNPTYLRLRMVEEAVSLHIANLAESFSNEYNSGSRTMTPKYVKALRAVAKGMKLSEAQIKSLKVSPGLRQILENRKTSIAFIRKIVESRRAGKQALNEGEIDSAQTTLAAQDIADQIQTMIEKFADIQYKELPALHDSIRNSKGVEEAQEFNASLLDSLSTLTQALESAKMDVNNAVAQLTGQELSLGDGDLDMDNIEGDVDIDADLSMGGDEGLGDEFDMDFEEEPDTDMIDMGRGRR